MRALSKDRMQQMQFAQFACKNADESQCEQSVNNQQNQVVTRCYEDHSANRRSADLRDAIFKVLPASRHLIGLILDAPRHEIEARLGAMLDAGTIGERKCSLTGRRVITDRRVAPGEARVRGRRKPAWRVPA